jgi:hypothetical protein
METGLDGNIFTHNFAKLGCLATHSWMKILWEYLAYLDITFELSDRYEVPALRANDFSIMKRLSDLGWSAGRLVAANRVRKFKQVSRLSCVATCDGRYIRSDATSRTQGRSSRRWSIEMPTHRDFALWKQALQVISSSSLRIQHPLGQFVSLPHIHHEWTTDEEGELLCRNIGDGSFALYEMVRPFRFTRSGPKYSFRRYSRDDPCLPMLATVLNEFSSAEEVKLHSSARLPVEIHQPMTFLERLHSWENQSLWRNLRVDNGGDWILDALVAGSLDIVHDGSYMKKVSPKVCSMALKMRCRVTGQQLKCSWVEMSHAADNYRGELLGAVCCSLLLKAAASSPAAYPKAPVARHCDNMGVIKHGNRLYGTLRDKQAQADLIRLIRSIDESLPFRCQYVWVESHTDSKYKRRRVVTEM